MRQRSALELIADLTMQLCHLINFPLIQGDQGLFLHALLFVSIWRMLYLQAGCSSRPWRNLLATLRGGWVCCRNRRVLLMIITQTIVLVLRPVKQVHILHDLGLLRGHLLWVTLLLKVHRCMVAHSCTILTSISLAKVRDAHLIDVFTTKILTSTSLSLLRPSPIEIALVIEGTVFTFVTLPDHALARLPLL